MLDQLIIILRAAQLYTHNAHNLIKGPVFFEDHEFLGDLYPKYETTYDLVVERMIGLNIPINLTETQVGAVQVLQRLNISSDPNMIFSSIIQLEKMINQKSEQCSKLPEYSEGTRQMLGNICDESEQRQYKLKQRVANG